MREYLLYCTCCNEYTSLGRFWEKEGHFEGEYSLLHNRRLDGDDLLGRFLLRHLGHCLKPYPSRTGEYADVLKTASRFMDADIDAIVEQAAERRKRRADDLLLERGLGQLQLNLFARMLGEEAESLAKTPTRSAAEGQFMLGKEEGLKQALLLLRELMERTNSLYR